MTPSIQVFILGNHGLIVAGDSAEHVTALMGEVERRLAMPVLLESTQGDW
jgi:ribulose-5-phosphate 4-epimerase/fuculose-1-phosphate aldolase